jgi:spore maturation protein CgeB
MRWLVAHPGPGFSVHDVFVGWVEALRDLGEQVLIFNLDDRLCFYDSVVMPTSTPGEFRKALTPAQAIELATSGLAAALFKTRPDVLLVVSGFFTDTDLLDQARRYGTKVVLLCTESPYEDARQLQLAGHADLVLLNDPTNLEDFRAVTQAVYAPHAYRRLIHHPGGEPSCDLVFIGTGYPSRVGFFEAMGLDGVDVVLGGNWQGLSMDSPLRGFIGHAVDECVDNDQAANAYRSARCGINLYRREADDADHLAGWAMGPREVEMAACGLFFLRDPRPEGDQVLSMLPTFAGPQEAGEQLRWYLQRPTLRRELAASAMGAIKDRTFANSATQLLRLFDRAPATASAKG